MKTCINGEAVPLLTQNNKAHLHLSQKKKAHMHKIVVRF